MLIRFKLAQTVPVKTSIQPGFSLRARNQPAKTTLLDIKMSAQCKPKNQICDQNIKIHPEIFFQTRILARRCVQIFLLHAYLINFFVLVTPETEGLDRERDGLSRPLEGVQTCQVPKLNPATISTYRISYLTMEHAFTLKNEVDNKHVCPFHAKADRENNLDSFLLIILW